ncbi:MAG: Ig-like domain-containing protein [Flavobacteriaceae bacterium]|nr:Ig-like domain-containing protein [Flavobacteriaceae bacterium]
MKFLTYLSLTFITLFFVGCIGEDVIDDAVDPEVRITNSTTSIAVGETYQFEATYFNNIGQADQATLLWSVSDESLISIDGNGLATGLSEGEVSISVQVILQGNITIQDENAITITMEIVDEEPIVKTGQIYATSGYTLEGDYTIEEIFSTNSVRITFAGNYAASSNLPGLYLYLTNNPNSTNGAYNAGPVTTFIGTHTYEFDAININDYEYLLYWCEPFAVKVGEGRAD